MVSRNLVICDQEERYAAALAHFFMKTKELALGVQVCNSVAQALRLQEESPIDILLIASGADKADAIYKTVCGPITPECPASILQLHPDVVLVCDAAALSKLEGTGVEICG